MRVKVPLSEDSSRPLTKGSGPYLITSPYVESEHLLDLGELDNESALLAEALVHLRCMRDDYATAPYGTSFNWDDVMDVLQVLARGQGFKETSFFIVVFRSQVLQSARYETLGALDKAAHAEANSSGGFLKYWFGSPDAERRNMATCVWRCKDDASRAGRGAAHRAASRVTAAMYASWKIDRYRLVVSAGANSWDLVYWTE